MQNTSFEAIGTKWSIAAECPSKHWAKLTVDIYKRIAVFDKNYSRFRPDSLVSQMSQRAGTYELPNDGYKLLKFYEDLYRATAGQVTPLIGQTLSDAGYDASYSLKPKPLTKPPTWDEVIEYNHNSITLQRPALLDFGAAGKGYLVDIVSDLMSAAGLDNYVIDASGDILHRSSAAEPIKIGLENPTNTAQAVGVARLQNQSLCASASAKRQWGNYNHLLNPTTLTSPNQVIATWVVAGDTMTADGLATALFFCEPEKISQFDFAYAILKHDMSLQHSKRFPADFFEGAK